MLFEIDCWVVIMDSGLRKEMDRKDDTYLYMHLEAGRSLVLHGTLGSSSLKKAWERGLHCTSSDANIQTIFLPRSNTRESDSQ